MAVDSAVATPEAAAAKPAGKSKLMLIGGAVVLLTAGAGGGVLVEGQTGGVRQPARSMKRRCRPATAGWSRSSRSWPIWPTRAAGGSFAPRCNSSSRIPTPPKKWKRRPCCVMQARSIILELLTTQRADDSVTPEGKAALRKAIVAQVTEALHDVEVVDVLFSDFVVQF